MSRINEPVDTFIQIAQVWSGLLGYEVKPRQVALCLAGASMVRSALDPDSPGYYEDGHTFLNAAERIMFDRSGPKQNPFDAIMAPYEGGDPNHPEGYDCHGYAMSDSERCGSKEHKPYGPAQDNARQSEFYAKNDRTKEAGPDEEERLPSMEETLAQQRERERLHMGPHSEDEPIPYTLSDIKDDDVMSERVQHLRRAPLVIDGAWLEVLSKIADWSDEEFELAFGIPRPEKP